MRLHSKKEKNVVGRIGLPLLILLLFCSGALGQETREKRRPVRLLLAPQITLVNSIRPDEKPVASIGKLLVIQGNRFSPDSAKNKIVISKLRPQPIARPVDVDIVAEIRVSKARPDQIEVIVPRTLAKGTYLVWVYVEGYGYSNASKVSLDPIPMP